MYAKMLVIVIGVVIMGLALLGLRQQRLARRHEMTRLHGQINDTRKQIWAVQTRIARQTTPRALQKAVEEAGLKLEPVTEFDIARPNTWPGVGPRFVRGAIGARENGG